MSRSYRNRHSDKICRDHMKSEGRGKGQRKWANKKVRKAAKSERPSVLEKLNQFKELVKHAVLDRNKRKELER